MKTFIIWTFYQSIWSVANAKRFAFVLPPALSTQLNHGSTLHHIETHMNIIDDKKTTHNQKLEQQLPQVEENNPLVLIKEPNENESNYGRQKYWNEFYQEKDEFSWYSPWIDIAPFFMELVPLSSLSDSAVPRILLPGIGNDSSMVHMYDDGYTHLTAFDYAEEGVECARKFFGNRLLLQESEERQTTTQKDNNEILKDCKAGVDLRVADARELPYKSNSFDAILEKGTLDAIYLSGGKDKELATEYLTMAINEFTRVTCIGGIVMSITAACTDAIESVFSSKSDEWEVVRDGSFYMTEEEGYSSNNIDATIFAWRRIK